MVLIIKDRDSFLSQTIEEVISELSTSVSSLEISSFCDGLAKTRRGQIQATLKDSLLIPLGFIKIAGEGKEEVPYICKGSGISSTNYTLPSKSGQTLKLRILHANCQPAPEPSHSNSLHPMALNSPIWWKRFTSRIVNPALCQYWPFTVLLQLHKALETTLFSTVVCRAEGTTSFTYPQSLLPLLQGVTAWRSGPGPAPASAS